MRTYPEMLIRLWFVYEVIIKSAHRYFNFNSPVTNSR